jgi:hypothetical protein
MNEIEQDAPASEEPVPVPAAAPEPESLAVAAPEPAPLPPEPAPPAARRVEAGPPSLVELLLNPRRFFEALETRPVSLRVPFLIVLVAGIFGAIAAYLVSSVLLNAMAIPGVEGLGGVFGAIGGISALIIALLFWVIYTAVFFLISMAFKGRGDFNRLLAYIAMATSRRSSVGSSASSSPGATSPTSAYRRSRIPRRSLRGRPP